MSDLSGMVITDALGIRYRLQRLVGSGGEASVYQATASRHKGEMVAVKVFDPTRTDLLHTMFVESAARKVFGDLEDSEYLVKLLDIVRNASPPHPEEESVPLDGDWTYLVMQWISGQPLNRYFDTYGIDDLSPIATAARGLATLHARLIHGDVKPSNIVVVEAHPTNVGRIVDLGAAVRVGADPSERQASSPPYTSERILTEPAHPRHDAYSLGMVALRCAVSTDRDLDERSAALERMARLYGTEVAAAVERALGHGLRDDETIADLFAPLSGALRRTEPGPPDDIATAPHPPPDQEESEPPDHEVAPEPPPRREPADHTLPLHTPAGSIDYATLIPSDIRGLARSRFRFLIFVADPANWRLGLALAAVLGAVAGSGLAAVLLR